MRISSLLKDRRRSPLQETCDWMEYVLRHGGARHLRAQVFNIPWYQYYLLDVIAFLVAMVTFVVMVIRLICTCLCRFCCKKDSNKTKKEWTHETKTSSVVILSLKENWVLQLFWLLHSSLRIPGADLGGGCRGCASPPPTPEMTCGFLIQLVFRKKKKVCGLSVLK